MSKVYHFFVLFLFTVYFYPCCSNFLKVEDMLWIEEIVKSTPTPPFFTISTVDMLGLVHLHKVVARSAFSIFPSAQNGVELKGEVESEGLKHQFSQVEEDLDL
jgi:hypothetical protein